MDCKRRGVVCVMSAQGMPCMGQVTQTGCGAICPRMGRGCYGCFGPMETPNAVALSGRLAGLGMDAGTLRRVYRTFNANAAAFREESERHGA